MYNKNFLLIAKFMLKVLTGSLLLTLSIRVNAEDYFDPSFLSLSGEENQLDLSIFSKKGGFAEGEYNVSVFLNNQSVGQYTLSFIKNSKDIVSPNLTLQLLNNWGVNVSNLPEFKALSLETNIDDLSEYIPSAKSKFDLSRLRLDISIPQVAMKPKYSRNVDSAHWDNGIPAFMVNYGLSAGRTENDNNFSHHADNLFASLRMGVNTGAWRLRSTLTHTYMQSVNSSNQSNRTDTRTNFSNTYLYRDVVPLRSTFWIGEIQTGSDIFEGVPLKGIKLTSNDQMLPSQLRGFAPSISGIANSNARIRVHQNGNIIYETYVAPGPFYINDIQASGLSGDLDVTIIETDGSERQFTVPYSSLPVMLRPGGWKYEVTAGRYNGHLTTSSRDADFMLGTLVYGLPENITLFGGLLVGQHYQSINIGSGISLGSFGAFSLDVTQSNTKFNEQETLYGQSYRLRYSKSILSTGTSFDLSALRYSTEDFYTFNEFNSEGYRLVEGVNPWTLERRRSSFQTQISQQAGNFGRFSLRLNRDNYWGTDKTQTGMSLGYSNTFKGVNLGINYSIDRVKTEMNDWPENRQISANISIPFSIFGYNPDLQAMYATAMITHDNNGKTNNYMGVSGNALDGDLNYSINQSWGNQNQIANSNLSLGYKTTKGALSAGYSYSNNSQSMNINANGGVVFHANGITLSRSMGESIALVNTPEASGVSVNSGSAITDSKGYAVAPYLSDYRTNNIGLDPTTLPDNVDLKQTNINVTPTRGAVVQANFATRIGYKALMTVKHNEKNYVQFGAIATLAEPKIDDTIDGIVGDNGLLYITGIPKRGKMSIKWGNDINQQCMAFFDLDQEKVNPNALIPQININCMSSYPDKKAYPLVVETAPISSYTLQLAANKSSVETYELLQRSALKYNLKNYSIYQAIRHNQQWMVLVAGEYQTKQEAQEAINSLPQEFKRNRPWIRKFGSVQAELNPSIN
ncbi:TPA: fimbria/pilus outer membrane usher protein [Vibrio metschnikovii]